MFEDDDHRVVVTTAWGLLSPSQLSVVRDGVTTLEAEGVYWIDEETALHAIEGGWL